MQIYARPRYSGQPRVNRRQVTLIIAKAACPKIKGFVTTNGLSLWVQRLATTIVLSKADAIGAAPTD